MKVIYALPFVFMSFLNAQIEGFLNNEAIETKKIVLDSILPSYQLDTLNTDSLLNKTDIPLVKLKSKQDLIRKDSMSRANQKLNKVRYRNIIMDTILIRNYKVYYEGDKQRFIDTTLSIEKEYKFNYLRKDYFELIPMPNVGQGFNKMGYDFTKEKLSPQLGATAKNYGYIEREDIEYFEVPTPLTELFFKTTFDQGQLLDALISVNTSPNFNLTIAHKGLRSLGNYIDSKTNGTHLRISSQYNNYNKRYQLRTHLAAQKMTNQENGGIDSLSVYFFEKAIEDLEYDGFLDRSRLTTNLKALSAIQGKRYHLNQWYKLIPEKNDSLEYNLKIGHAFTYETKNHLFSQNQTNNYLELESDLSSFEDIHKLRSLQQEFYSNYNLGKMGVVNFGIKFDNWKYFKENNSSNQEEVIDQLEKLDINQFTLNAGWKKNILGYTINARIDKTLKDQYGYSLYSSKINKEFRNKLYINTEMEYRSETPNFNFFLHRSSYDNYNWYNSNWLQQKTSSIFTEVGHPFWGVISAKFQKIVDYNYFRDDTPTNQINKIFLVSPFQYNGQINYLKIKFYNRFKFWKLELINTLQFQEVNTASILNVPKWITRNSLIFESFIFKKALFFQAGGTIQYFTKYYADQYHPVLGEFAVQNHTLVGDFPRIDLFVNAKIQQTRIYFKFEHFNSHETGYNYYSAPFTPYRDSVIRFGLVWNFFQ